MILLDTHVWVWWVQGDPRLHHRASAILDKLPAKSVAISSISFWEVAMLAQRDRIRLPDTPRLWLHNAATDPRLVILPLTADIATEAALLPEKHKDPADRIIIAHAIMEGLTRISEDEKIHAYEGVRTLRPAALEFSGSA